MARYSLALCAAAVLIHENAPGGERAFIAGGEWELHTGDLGDLGSAYTLYEKINDIPRQRMPNHPLKRNASVRNSISSSRDGQEMFHLTGYLNYPGVSNAWGRVFSLNDEWRKFTLESARGRAKNGKLDAREQKLLDCLELLNTSKTNK